jgi:hypothetical protein
MYHIYFILLIKYFYVEEITLAIINNIRRSTRTGTSFREH